MGKVFYILYLILYTQYAMLIDGKKIGQEILNNLYSEVKKLPFQPIFCDILVGKDPASVQYVKMKGQAAEKIGIAVHKAEYPENITTEELLTEIHKLNQIKNMCGLIVQLPLPPHINQAEVLNSIDPAIDVDVTGEVNSQKFYLGEPNALEFPTAVAILNLLDSTGENLKEKNFLVMGFGMLVGRPVSYLLEKKGYKVAVARSKTANTNELLKNADVVISATGKPNIVTGEKIKPGSIIIDAGTSESEGGIVGDVDFESVNKIASFVSPVPGGVGAVTVAMLLSNVVQVAKTMN